MNKLLTIVFSALVYLSAFAQAPEKMSYQSVIRNNSGVLVSNATVGIRISILQGSASGTSVFSETHSILTNANGLASLAIGGGTPVSGSIDAIDWSAGPFFIKTETDPAGGSSYSITATSQLLSVPYALYAEESGDLPSGNNEGDMLYWTGSAWATIPVASDGDILTICEGVPVWTKQGQCKPFYLGQHYQGGIIFYIDSTGDHGLIAAENDFETAPWGCDGDSTGALGYLIGDGATNTELIELACTTPGTAADLCANLTLNGYSDWYLPSLAELYVLYVNQHYVGGFYTGEAHYWSSTEYNQGGAWDVVFIYPWDSRHITAKNQPGRVRAIRTF